MLKWPAILLTFLAFLLQGPNVQAQTTIYTDDFESGASGWSSSTNESTSSGGGFLGRFRPGSPTSSTQRTFAVPANTELILIEFDFLEIDSWDGDIGDEFAVDIDGTRIFSLPFFHQGRAGTDGNDAARSGTTGTVAWSVSPLTDNTIQLGFSGWTDQIHRVRLEIPNPGPVLDVEFVADINQSDEAVGIDNISIIGFPAVVFSVAKTSSLDAGLARVPGAEIRYTIQLSNDGAAIDSGSIIVTDVLPADVTMFTGNLDGSGASVVFNDTAASGIACCVPAQISYAQTASPADPFDYTPNGAFDDNVRQIRITPSGSLRNGQAAGAMVEFEVLVQIK